MQTNRNHRARPQPAPTVPTGRGRYTARNNNQKTIITLILLCLLLPPLGIYLLWRAERVTLPLRGGFTALGFASMLIICRFLVGTGGSMDLILPTPATPVYSGYGDVALSHSSAVQTFEAPAQPDSVPVNPNTPDVPVVEEPNELTDDTIVYAVTNNASSYHLYQICDLQENNRALTLREALNEGLAPCEKCVGAAG